MGARYQRRDRAVGKADRGARGVLYLNSCGRGLRGDGADHRKVGETADVAERVELVDGVHHYNPAPGHGLTGPPVELPGRPPVVAALVDDGAEPNEPHVAASPVLQNPARCHDGAGAAQFEEDSELALAGVTECAKLERG